MRVPGPLPLHLFRPLALADHLLGAIARASSPTGRPWARKPASRGPGVTHLLDLLLRASELQAAMLALKAVNGGRAGSRADAPRRAGGRCAYVCTRIGWWWLGWKQKGQVIKNLPFRGVELTKPVWLG